MGIHGNAYSIEAGGDINPCRFIRQSTTEDHTALESDAGSLSIGISGEGSQDAPQTGASALIAADGESFEYHPWGDECLLEIGTGGVTRNDLIKPDADGKGVTAATADDIAGALAVESAAAGEKCRVLVMSPHRIHA